MKLTEEATIKNIREVFPDVENSESAGLFGITTGCRGKKVLFYDEEYEIIYTHVMGVPMKNGDIWRIKDVIEVVINRQEISPAYQRGNDHAQQRMREALGL